MAKKVFICLTLVLVISGFADQADARKSNKKKVVFINFDTPETEGPNPAIMRTEDITRTEAHQRHLARFRAMAQQEIPQ